ncbi:MAG TPA: hypothetical protein VFA46_23460 [Actinomycetes bacterium]|jgi:hypothetical protein|nr:hypothetical protein [Actinomycetes bacterium]
MPTPPTPDQQPADATARERATIKARRAAARAWVARTRAAQGLPAHVQDGEIIAELVLLFRPTPSDHDDAQHRGEHDDGGDDLPGAADPSATPSADPSAD